MHLLANLAVTTLVGHSRVAVCCAGVRDKNPGVILLSLPNKQLRLSEKLLQDTRKC